MADDYFAVPGVEGDPCDPTGAARCGLLALMFGLSEECWQAGWLSDLEYRLWEASPPTVGLGYITGRQVALLHLLAEEAGGWWTWADTEDPAFVPMAEWDRMFADWPRRQRDHADRRAVERAAKERAADGTAPQP